MRCVHILTNSWLLLAACGGGGNGSGSGDAGSASQTGGCRPFGASGLCECSPSTTGTAECTPRSVDLGNGAICCSDPNTKECFCGALYCDQLSTFCQCDWAGVSTGGSSQSQCTAKYCCASNGGPPSGACACSDDTPCGTDVQVTSCSALTTPRCTGGTVEVASCSK